MSDWGVLGLSQNPAPGDPASVRQTARRFTGEADTLQRAGSRLTSIAASGGDLGMVGDYASGFQDALDDLPGELSKSERAYRGCGQALSKFSTSLEHAQAVAGTALNRGTTADTQYTGAVQQIRNLLPPDRHLTVSSGLGLSDGSVDSATQGLDESLRDQIRGAARRARQAEADRGAARQLALQAANLRGDAEDTCANEIDDSLHDIKNKHWWQKAWDATVHVVTWPFTSWDHFVKFCEVAGAVLGVAAIFLSGPVGWAIAGLAIAASAVSLADTAVKYANGEAGPWALAFAVLGVIPGLGAGGKMAGLLGKMGRELPLVGKVFGAGTRVASRFGTAARSVGSRAWPKIANGFSKVREQAIPMAKRAFGRDPIDMASGHVVLQQTDLKLPGLLELVIERTHLSSYQAGRWFGPTWSSFLDQRLELDGDRLLLAAPDATLLCFPVVPRPGQIVRPLEGPRLELLAAQDDSYQVTDPQTGLTSLFAARDGISDVGDGTLPLVAVTDRNGHQIMLDYTSDGVLAMVRHSGGYRVRIDTEDNRITGLRLLGTNPDDTNDPGTQIIGYRYDGSGRLAEVVNSSGLPLRFSYDHDGRLVRWEDRNGTWYQYAYDDRGRCVLTSGSDGCLSGQLIYDETARTTVEINSLRHATTYQLNELSQVVAVTDPLGSTTRTDWDPFDHQLAVLDALGNVTNFEYDDAFNLTATHRPGGRTTRAVYNSLHLPVRLTMPDGTVWQRRYDRAGNLLRVTDPTGAQTSYEYGENGRLASITDARGATTRFTTNPAGLVTSVADPLGASTACELDAFGRVVSLQDAAGALTRAEYSPDGWLTLQLMPNGSTRAWHYDGEGNVVAEIDEQGRETTTRWTHFDLLSGRTLPDGSQQGYSYDTELRLVGVTDGLGRIWSFEYDAAGRMVRERDVNGRVISYQHDVLGQIVERINGAGESVQFGYDGAGNLVRKSVAGVITDYRFDVMDRLVSATSPDAGLVIERDQLGRVVAETCAGLTSRFGYDEAGLRTSRTTPSGATSTWTYDPAGRPERLHTAGRTVAFTHDILGRETQRVMGTAGVLDQTWGEGFQLLSQSVRPAGPETDSALTVPVARRQYGYDTQGRLLSLRDQARGSTDFDLDLLGRVTAARTGATSEQFGYDHAGTITASTPLPGDGPASAEPIARELAGTITKRAGVWRYEHDDQGRMTLRQRKTLSSKAQNWHYTWDAEDRLVGVTTPDGTPWRYLYDGVGRRIAKQRLDAEGSAVAEEQRFVWDGALLAEQITSPSGEGDSDGIDASAITWDWHPYDIQPLAQMHRVLYQEDGDEQAWFDEQFFSIVTDLIGTPSELLDDGGNVAWLSRANVWGDQSSPPADIDCPLAFPGQYRDDETGLHYNVFRYYDAISASFASSDPLGILAGSNPHSYVLNPTMYIDPYGLSPYPAGPGGTPKALGPGTSPQIPSPHLPSGRPDFIVGKNGVTVPTSRARLEKGFQDAGFPSVPARAPGTIWTMPDGTLVRIMEPSGQAPLRASFTNASQGHISPFTGVAPQPPPGIKGAAWKAMMRDLTHIDLSP